MIKRLAILTFAIGCFSNSPIPAASDSLNVLQKAESLEECLLNPENGLRAETTVLADGLLSQSLQLNAADSRSHKYLNRSIAACSGKTTGQACTFAGNLRRDLTVELNVLEAHPAWSSNDRARLADLLPQTASEVSESNSRIGVVQKSNSTSTTPLRLKLSIAYAGTTISAQPIDDWVVMPRRLNIELKLEDNTTRQILAERTIQINLPAGVRPRYESTSASPWFVETMAAVSQGTQEVLGALECQSDLLTTNRTPSGRWQLRYMGFNGLTVGRTVLLIPAGELSPSIRWPLARISELLRDTHTAELKIIAGNETVCADGNCTAIIL